MATTERITPPRTNDPIEQDRWRRQITRKQNERVAATQADSTAADVATIVADFNGLLAKLKAAGLMESS